MITMCECCKAANADIEFNTWKLCFNCAKQHFPINPVPVEVSTERLIKERDALAEEYNRVCKLNLEMTDEIRVNHLDSIADKVADLDIEIRKREKEQKK